MRGSDEPLASDDIERDAAVGSGQRIGRDDTDLARRQLRLAAFDFFGEGFRFFIQCFEHFGFGHRAGLLALHIDDAATLACKDCDVGPFGFSGSVDDATHDSHFHWRLDVCQLMANFGDEFDQVDFDAATRWAGDEFGFFAVAHTEYA